MDKEGEEEQQRRETNYISIPLISIVHRLYIVLQSERITKSNCRKITERNVRKVTKFTVRITCVSERVERASFLTT